MSAPDVANREITGAEVECDLLKSVTDQAAEPDTAYEAFLLCLEMARFHRDQASVQEPAARRINAGSARDENFPTEWTLDP